MDTDRLRSLAPHYAAMLILVLLIPDLVRTIVGDFGFWVDMAIVVAVVLAYRPVVMRLGIGPSEWE